MSAHTAAAEIKATNTHKGSLNKKDQKDKEVIKLKDGTAIKILPLTDHVKYFGKQLNPINHTDKDIDEHIRNGWIKFNEFQTIIVC